MKIAIASGKGGTGKTMVAANLAFTLSRDGQVTLVDCDVEEPNLHLFFPAPAVITEVTLPVPVIDENTCQHCGLCGEFCQYGAITVLPTRVLFFPELCHSCGGCMLVCPNDAIHEEPKRIGTVAVSTPLPRLKLISGMLDTGNPHAVPVIRAAKKLAVGDPLVICDSAPGTSCPVVETLDGCDCCILVTESTPFGLHDLRLAVDVLEPAKKKKRGKATALTKTSKKPGPKKESMTGKLIALVQQSKSGISVENIIKKTKIEKQQAWNILSTAKKDGKIKSIGRGVYAPA